MLPFSSKFDIATLLRFGKEASAPATVDKRRKGHSKAIPGTSLICGKLDSKKGYKLLTSLLPAVVK